MTMSKYTKKTLANEMVKSKHIPDWIDSAIASLGENNAFPSKPEAEMTAKGMGLTPLNNYDEDGLHLALGSVGFKFRFNIISKRIETAHEVFTNSEWLAVRKKDKIISMLSRAVHKTACIITKDGKDKEKEGEIWRIGRIRFNAWGKTTDSIIGDLFGLVVEHGKGQIPAIHPFREFLNVVRKHRELLSDELLDNAKELAKTWINYIPHIEPENPILGNAASFNIIGGLATRLLESEKESNYRPKMQRELVLLASPIEKQIGKTAIITSLVPPELNKSVLENFTIDDDTKMYRNIKGKFFVIADDLSGFTAKQGEKWKSFQTQTRPTVDEKFENTEEFARTDWIAGTANQIFLPSDQALHSRMIVCEMTAKPDSANIPHEKRGKDINHFFNEYRLSHIRRGAFAD